MENECAIMCTMTKEKIINIAIHIVRFVSYFTLIVFGLWSLVEIASYPSYAFKDIELYFRFIFPILIIIFLHPAKKSIGENNTEGKKVINNKYIYFSIKALLIIIAIIFMLICFGYYSISKLQCVAC